MTSASPSPGPSTCPVCNARRRPTVVCARCGAELDELQRIELAAWRRRREGWQRLLAGDASGAAALARESGSLAESPSARRLAWLVTALAGAGSQRVE